MFVGISVKNENDDPEINAMALKMKETFQKNATSLRQQGVTTANVYINRAGRPVALNAVAISSPNALQKLNQEKSKDTEDSESIRGKQSQNKLFVLKHSLKPPNSYTHVVMQVIMDGK